MKKKALRPKSPKRIPHHRRHFAHTVAIIALVSWGLSLAAFTHNKSAIVAQVGDFVAAAALPYNTMKLAKLPADIVLFVPVEGIEKDQIADTWGAARAAGRSHEGTDIFAERGTEVLAAANGYVWRTGVNKLGGTYVFTIGAGGVRYYYAHLNEIAEGIKPGKEVTVHTVIGYVGNTGNAATTDPHLHFGMYSGRGAKNPYPLLIDRPTDS